MGCIRRGPLGSTTFNVAQVRILPNDIFLGRISPWSVVVSILRIFFPLLALLLPQLSCGFNEGGGFSNRIGTRRIAN
jgi:hypothetical protein